MLPVRRSDLVLDVGSGGNPYPQADVLLERYVNPFHRAGAKLVVDRPTVLGDACRMPFKDGAFDFVVASHVLEHIARPDQFLGELTRVGRAGYIETPNILFERLVPYDVHLLEIMLIDGVLVIHKKPEARPDRVISSMKIVPRDDRWTRLFYERPQLFHVRYFWRGKINFVVVNADVDMAWFGGEDAAEPQVEAQGEDSLIRGFVKRGIRLYRRTGGRAPVDLAKLLVCPDCRGPLARSEQVYQCQACAASYANAGLPDFTKKIGVRA